MMSDENGKDAMESKSKVHGRIELDEVCCDDSEHVVAAHTHTHTHRPKERRGRRGEPGRGRERAGGE